MYHQSAFYEKIRELLPQEQILCDEPMSRHTTFRVGGPADYYVIPKPEQAAAVLELCRREQMPCTVIGNGSNLLVGDGGIRGVVLAFAKPAAQIRVEGRRIVAGAGALLSQVAREAQNSGLDGFAFAAGIPGSLGGAVVMNAGAYGGEMKNVLVSARVLTEDGQERTLSCEELDLSYRHSCIQERHMIVLEATLELYPGEPEEIRAQMEELRRRRVEKQPLEYPSAGSTFKRPEGYFAGKLIMDAGLAGCTVGGAQVSAKHCGFVINAGGATASDLMELISLVRQRVRERFGVALELEVRCIGEFERV